MHTNLIREILLEILAHGLIRIRGFGFAGNAHACAVEADHIHNLPSLIGTYNNEVLEFYYNVERKIYLKHNLDNIQYYETLWEKLILVKGDRMKS